jgi:hypothetical protein
MNRVRTELAPPPWGKSFLSSWSSTESAPNQNENHVGLESTSLTSYWNKFPYIRSHPEWFNPSKPSSDPSHRLSRCHTIVLSSASSQPYKKDLRSRLLPLVFSPSPEVHWRPPPPTHHRPSLRKKGRRYPHWPLLPQGRQNELTTSPQCCRSKPHHF